MPSLNVFPLYTCIFSSSLTSHILHIPKNNSNHPPPCRPLARVFGHDAQEVLDRLALKAKRVGDFQANLVKGDVL